MKKVITSVFITALMLYVPLIGKKELLLDAKMVFPTICSIWLLIKQKELKWHSIKQNAATDGYSTLLIVLVGMISQAIPIIEWRFNTILGTSQLNFWNYLGVAMLFGGLFLRLQAIEDLNMFFTNEVRVDKHWQLINTGLYKYIRHPSYLGAYLTMTGTSVLFEAWFSLLAGGIALWLIYFYRIRLEERLLLLHFGESYQHYINKTKRIFFIF